MFTNIFIRNVIVIYVAKGYMPHEYVMKGANSRKSDIYNF